MKPKTLVALVLDELERAQRTFPPFNSAHEGYAVIKEALDELWDEVRKRRCDLNRQRMAEEAIQVAAMGMRFYLDVCDSPKESREDE